MSMIQQLVNEAAAEAGLRFLLDEVAAYIAANPELWQGGDGKRAHVHLWLDKAAKAHGLDAGGLR